MDGRKAYSGRSSEPIRLTKETILKACKGCQGYSTPRLNENLYLQRYGFIKIENLEEYTGTVALWLEENAISKISNLSHMKNLKCLFLQTNAIKKIEGLHRLVQLRTLNISNNMLSRIENLSRLSQLHTLEISRNLLSSVDDIAHLVRTAAIGHLLVTLYHSVLRDDSVESFGELVSLDNWSIFRSTAGAVHQRKCPRSFA